MNLPPPGEHASLFRLEPSVIHLNHGSFGACPIAVLDAQARHRDRMEADGVRFFMDDAWGLLDVAREALAPVVGTAPANLVFVPNATTGIATILHNIALRAGDEILASNLEYPACLVNCRAFAARAGARVVCAELPFPVASEDAIADALLARVTPRTRVAMFSLVTSSTALRLPVERLIPVLRERGILVILDAAHGPGCVPVKLDAWQPDYATGNCHKWLCAPKGAAFLHVRAGLQEGFRSLVLSSDAERLDEAAAATRRPPWHHEFDYTGTSDITPRLAIADSIAFMEGLMPGGLRAVMDANRALCLRGRDIVCARLGVAPPAPDAMLGPMAAIPLASAKAAAELKRALLERHRIQIPFWDAAPGSARLRLSAQVYNSEAQYEALAEALASEL